MDKASQELIRGLVEKARAKLAVQEAREFLAEAERYLQPFLSS